MSRHAVWLILVLLPPRDAWVAFRQLPLTDAEIRTVATNVGPYLR